MDQRNELFRQLRLLEETKTLLEKGLQWLSKHDDQLYLLLSARMLKDEVFFNTVLNNSKPNHQVSQLYFNRLSHLNMLRISKSFDNFLAAEHFPPPREKEILVNYFMKLGRNIDSEDTDVF